MPRMQKKVHGSRRRPAKASRPDSRNNDDVSGWYWGTYEAYVTLQKVGEIIELPEPEPVLVHEGKCYVVWYERKLRKTVPILMTFPLEKYVLKGPITCTNI